MVAKTIQDALDELVKLNQAETSYAAREQALVTAVTAQRDALQATVDAGATVDTTALIAQMDAMIAAIPSDVPPVVAPVDPGEVVIGTGGTAGVSQKSGGEKAGGALHQHPSDVDKSSAHTGTKDSPNTQKK